MTTIDYIRANKKANLQRFTDDWVKSAGKNNVSNGYSLSVRDIKDWSALIISLKDKKNIYKGRVLRLLDEQGRKIIDRWKKNFLNDADKNYLINGFNEMISKTDFYDPEFFKDLRLVKECSDCLEKGLENLKTKEVQRFNRLVFESVFPGKIINKREMNSAYRLIKDWASSLYVKGDFPDCFRNIFDSSTEAESGFSGLTIDHKFDSIEPEFKTQLPGGTQQSQTDLVILAKNGEQNVPVFAEAKYDEGFGRSILDTLKAAIIEKKGSIDSGISMRLMYLLTLLGQRHEIKEFFKDTPEGTFEEFCDDAIKLIPRNFNHKWTKLHYANIFLPAGQALTDMVQSCEATPAIFEIKYQLLYRTASALLYAKENDCPNTLLAIQSFDLNHAGLNEYNDFINLYNLSHSEQNPISGYMEAINELHGVKLYTAWISCPTQPCCLKDSDNKTAEEPIIIAAEQQINSEEQTPAEQKAEIETYTLTEDEIELMIDKSIKRAERK
jgi:hypothetical protein